MAQRRGDQPARAVVADAPVPRRGPGRARRRPSPFPGVDPLGLRDAVTQPLAADARAAARGGASLLALQTLGRILGVGFVVVVTRSLGPAQFGRYSPVARLV